MTLCGTFPTLYGMLISGETLDPAHPISLSFFDWALIMGVASITWVLIVRFIRSQDSLAVAVSKLTETVVGLPGWVATNYVAKPDHVREIDRLEEAFADQVERVRDDLRTHREECPGRRA